MSDQTSCSLTLFPNQRHIYVVTIKDREPWCDTETFKPKWESQLHSGLSSMAQMNNASNRFGQALELLMMPVLWINLRRLPQLPSNLGLQSGEYQYGKNQWWWPALTILMAYYFCCLQRTGEGPTWADPSSRRIEGRYFATISEKHFLQFFSSGYWAPGMNHQEPDGITSLGFVPHHEWHRFKDKYNATMQRPIKWE